MFSRVFSATTIGLESVLVEVEVDVLAGGLHSFTLVGLPDTAVKESRERVSSALKNAGFKPVHQSGRITVNLAPADVPKNSPIFDVPIALGYLQSTKVITVPLEKKLFVGELALSGEVRKIQGVLPITLFAKKAGFEEIYVPFENQEEALLGDITVYGIKNMSELVAHLSGERLLAPAVALKEAETKKEEILEQDFSHIVGQHQAKRALEIAAAGGHNVIFTGPPGSGKTLLAKAFAGILPDLTKEESFEVTKIHSVAGKVFRSGLITKRPFRAPHHTASAVSLIGGGSFPRPGELSLAHRGVLFLDEFSEFPRSVLESLRQPLEEGSATVSRAKGTYTFPARVMLLAAMNPCPCGYAGDNERLCQCSAYQVLKYQQKISGPILDRIDLQITVPRVPLERLQDKAGGESSKDIQARVVKARKIQAERFKNKDILTNAEMSGNMTKEFVVLSPSDQIFFTEAAKALGLSARGYMRVLKVARTIADLAERKDIHKEDLAEALQYRFNNE